MMEAITFSLSVTFSQAGVAALPPHFSKAGAAAPPPHSHRSVRGNSLACGDIGKKFVGLVLTAYEGKKQYLSLSKRHTGTLYPDW